MHRQARQHQAENAVSETIGAVMLISVVVVAVAIIAVVLTSQGTPQKIPALDAVISNVDRTVFVYHDGGDTLYRQDMYIMVNGEKQDFSKNGNAAWTSWSTGETLAYTVPGTDPITSVRIVFDNSQTATTLTSANFGPSGMATTVPTPTPTSAVIPVAAFSATPVSGITPLTVTFTDASANGPTSWSWDFGDGSPVATVQNPVHIYSVPGTYSVSLTATNTAGSDTETKIDYITAGVAPPVADFSGTPLTGTLPLSVTFTDASTNSPTSWSWDFGDGTPVSNDQNPVHIYNTAGSFSVTLTATNAGGSDSETKTDYISVAPPVPVVTGISPSTGPVAGGTIVTVTGTGFTGATHVLFGTTPNATGVMTVDSDTQITVTSPPGAAGTVDVTVTTPGGTSATSPADQFTYTAAPVVTGISPSSGPAAGGTSVTITGTGFTGATAVQFGTVAAGSFTVNSATSITAVSPMQPAGTVHVTVTAPGGTSATSPADRFSYYVIQTFTSSTTWTVPSGVTTVEYLVVAGGGGGGRYGGGGGAGGFRTGTMSVTSGSIHIVTIGAGGDGGRNTGTGKGANGGNSVFGSITATGGGGGGSRYTATAANWIGNSGGSGGGGAGNGGAGGVGTAGQGNNGGNGFQYQTGRWNNGGGGGASAAGSTSAAQSDGAEGGSGTTSDISGSSITYACGGGGGGRGAAGAAGCSTAGAGSTGTGSTASANRGGGGGGGGTNGNGGAGGSGIVIIKYY